MSNTDDQIGGSMAYDDLPEELRETYEAAVRLSESPEYFTAFNELARDPERAAKGGADLLREFGIDVPESLTFEVLVGHEAMPVPEDWWPFTIVLSNCRKFYKINRTKRPPIIEETEAVCFTFRIVPTPIPGGPWGH